MKLLHVLGGAFEHTGGPAESVPSLCSALVERGHRVSLATLEGPLSPAAKACSARGVTLATFPWRTAWYTPGFARGLARLCAESDLVHSNALWRHVNWSIGRTTRRTGKPHVLALRGCLEPTRLAHHRNHKRLIGWLFDDRNLRQAACLHATAESEYQSARSYGLENPVAIVRNGVDLDFFSRPANRELMLERFPELKGKKVLLYLSRLSWEKGMPLLAEAWGKVAAGFKDWHLLVVGRGEPAFEAQLRQTFERWDVADRTSWAGSLQAGEKLAALAVAELFVLPTLSENFGIVVAEALAAGLPVITTHGAPWAELTEQRCGWWVPVSADSIAEALCSALALSDAERSAMGERGRRLVEDNYNWGQIAEDMLSVYRWLLDGGLPPACVRLG